METAAIPLKTSRGIWSKLLGKYTLRFIWESDAILHPASIYGKEESSGSLNYSVSISYRIVPPGMVLIEGGFALKQLQGIAGRKGIKGINGTYFFHFSRIPERGGVDCNMSGKAAIP